MLFHICLYCNLKYERKTKLIFNAIYLHNKKTFLRLFKHFQQTNIAIHNSAIVQGHFRPPFLSLVRRSYELMAHLDRVRYVSDLDSPTLKRCSVTDLLSHSRGPQVTERTCYITSTP